jgi:energy-coupling factor transport system permease protein
MIDRIKGKYAAYPLLALAEAYAVFFIGMLLATKPYFWAFLLAVLLVDILFGYWKTAVFVLAVFLPISGLAGLIALPGAGGEKALQIAGRFLCLAIAAIPTAVMEPVSLVRVMNRMGFPRYLTLGMLVTIRFIPYLVDEMKQIRTAMKSRGIRASWYNPKFIYRALIIPVMLRIISISDLLTVSIETRGFVMKESKATVYQVPSWKIGDTLYTLMLVLVVILISGLGVWYHEE